MKIKIIPWVFILLLTACSIIIPATPELPTSTISPTLPATPAVEETRQVQSNSPQLLSTPSFIPTTTSLPEPLASLEKFTHEKFSSTKLADWTPVDQQKTGNELPVDWDRVVNHRVTDGLTYSQRASLIKNGFVIIHSQEDQFSDIRLQVSLQNGQPYFLTTDSAQHALHLAMDELLIYLEQEEFLPRLEEVTGLTLEEVLSYLPIVEGTPLEEDILLAAAYLSVAIKLLNPDQPIHETINDRVNTQIAQILDADGQAQSTLIPGYEDDFSLYEPTGHYTKSEQLENFYRTVTWLSRAKFKISTGERGFVPSRAPLILTLALRHARSGNEAVAQSWMNLYETFSYFYGPVINTGPIEYSNLMDQVYGANATIISVMQNELWEIFQATYQGLPPIDQKTSFGSPHLGNNAGQGWSYFGERVNPDLYIFQNTVSDNVGTTQNRRELPSGLDLMAALGSPTALSALEKSGAYTFENFSDQITWLQSTIKSTEEDDWLSSVYSSWIYALLAQIEAKSNFYPDYMQTESWTYKDLNSALGSWVELNHNFDITTEFQVDQSVINSLSSEAAPGYVEPNPAVFYRLSYLTKTTTEGLKQRGMNGGSSNEAGKLADLIMELEDLGNLFERLGDIAKKEIQGIPLDDADFQVIQTPLGRSEISLLEKNSITNKRMTPSSSFSNPAAISTLNREKTYLLHLGTGLVDRIYVIVPINGELTVAQGGVYSYYEFSHPRSEQLDDRSWRILLSANPPNMPAWSESFLLPGGYPLDLLAFRVGDVYQVTNRATDLKLYQQPDGTSKIISGLYPGETVLIVDGPVRLDAATWWKFEVISGEQKGTRGWAPEKPSWFQRIWDLSP